MHLQIKVKLVLLAIFSEIIILIINTMPGTMFHHKKKTCIPKAKFIFCFTVLGKCSLKSRLMRRPLREVFFTSLFVTNPAICSCKHKLIN